MTGLKRGAGQAKKRTLRFSQYQDDFIPKPLESLTEKNIDSDAKNTSE